jgi:hypothetical protein
MTAYPYTTFLQDHPAGRLSALFLQPRLPVGHDGDGLAPSSGFMYPPSRQAAISNSSTSVNECANFSMLRISCPCSPSSARTESAFPESYSRCMRSVRCFRDLSKPVLAVKNLVLVEPHRLGCYNWPMWYVAVASALIVCIFVAMRANRGHQRSSRASREMRDHMRRQSYGNDESA